MANKLPVTKTPKHDFVLGEVTFDPSWFKAMHLRGFTPEDLPNNGERQAYADYLQELQVTAQPKE